jgi:hypothetical protein
MPSTDWLQLCDDIDDGEFDSGLEEIAKAVQSRRDIVHRRAARRLQRELQKGDRVMLTNKVTPRYLEGCSATIRQMKPEQGAAVVDLDSLPTHRGRPPADGHTTRLLVPFIHLVKIDEGVQTLKNTDDAADIGDDEEYEDDIDDEIDDEE